jgi:hypothetical protein
LCQRIRRDDEQKTAPEPHTGFQGEGGARRRQRRSDDVFRAGSIAPTTPAVDVKSLHAKIGELTLENDFLEGALSKAGLLSAKR